MTAHVQDVFVLFGDSITQGSFEPGYNGIGQRLSHAYARKLDVINRGLSGYNTSWAIPVFDKCFATHSEQTHVPTVQLLTIWFGANDACIKPSPQHVPLEEFVQNLTYFIDAITSPSSPRYSPSTRIILITPPPVNTIQREADLASRIPPLALDRLFDTTREYADAVRKLGIEKSLPVADVFTAVWDAAEKEEANLSKYLADGLHMNAAGYEIAFDQLIQTIRQRYPEFAPENLQYVFTPWAEIDWKNPDNVKQSISQRRADGGNVKLGDVALHR